MAVRQGTCGLILISISIPSSRNWGKSRNLSQNGQSSGEYFDWDFLNFKHSISLLQQKCLVSWPETWHMHFESTDYKAFVKDQKGITLNKFLTSQTRDLLEKQRVTQPVKKCPLFCRTKTHSTDHMKLQPDPNTSTHLRFALNIKLGVLISNPN